MRIRQRKGRPNVSSKGKPVTYPVRSSCDDRYPIMETLQCHGALESTCDTKKQPQTEVLARQDTFRYNGSYAVHLIYLLSVMFGGSKSSSSGATANVKNTLTILIHELHWIQFWQAFNLTVIDAPLHVRTS